MRVTAPLEGHIRFEAAAEAEAWAAAMIESGRERAQEEEAALSRILRDGPRLFSDECRRSIEKLTRSDQLARLVEAHCVMRDPRAITVLTERAGPTRETLVRARLTKIDAAARQLVSLLEEDARDWRELFGIESMLTVFPDGPAWISAEKPPIIGALGDLASKAAALAPRTKGRPGKRRKQHAMSALVWNLWGVLREGGVPESAAENSRMVAVLRIVAQELGIDGDPRDELRKVQAIHKAVRNAGGVLSIGHAW